MSLHRTDPDRTRLTVTALNDRITPSATPLAHGTHAVGSDVGTAGTATVSSADGTEQFSVPPYGWDFAGGIRVAMPT